MREVAVIGAGELGGLCAHLLARRQPARVVRLIDEAGDIAAGKALDLRQASAVEGFATELTASADLASAAGADAIVLADRASGDEWRGDEALGMIARLVRAAPRALLVCAGASSRELVERAVRETRIDRRRVIGSAPEALAGAARALIALEAGGSPRDVALTMLGRPPAQIVVPWEDGAVRGSSLARVLDETARHRLFARLEAAWPPGPYALASAAALAVEAAAGRTRRTISAFVGPDDSLGAKMRTVAVPVRLGPGGATPFEPDLNARDQVAFDTARLL